MLDLAMPGLDGLGVLRALQQPGRPTMPVIVVSAFSPVARARAPSTRSPPARSTSSPNLPRGGDLDSFSARVGARRSAWRSRPRAARRTARRGSAGRVPHHRAAQRAQRAAARGPDRHLDRRPARARRTGPAAALPARDGDADRPAHAARLHRLARRASGSELQLQVREARGGESLDPRVALIAPGGRHLRLTSEGRTSLTEEPEIGGLRPRADLTIDDAARLLRRATVLVVLTGMGNDGLEGRARRSAAAAGGSSLEARDDLHRLRDAAGDRRSRTSQTTSCHLMNLPTRSRRRHQHERPRRRRLHRFCGSLRELCGIDLTQYKRPQMERRLRSFFERKGIVRLTDSLAELRRDPAQLDALLDRITINVSQLWRNPEQWALLESDDPPRARAARSRIARWSAGCSYGAEAYTLAAICISQARERRGSSVLGHRHRQADGRARAGRRVQRG